MSTYTTKRDGLWAHWREFLTVMCCIAMSCSVEGQGNSGGRSIRLFLAGDVMTGRGIDQLLQHPGNPQLHESYMKNAMGYVTLAERQNGRIDRPVQCSYIWGDSLTELRRFAPDLTLINLETSVTTSDDHWPGKGIHYRMNPQNIDCIIKARVDFASLANNHVLDWGYAGLEETIASLQTAGIETAGAGRNRQAAGEPAVLNVPGKAQVVVVSLAHQSSGVPTAWRATKSTAGVNLVNLNDSVSTLVGGSTPSSPAIKVTSIHWGGNWGYEIPQSQISFARRLVNEGGVDIVHGHSSHHPKGFEVYQGRLIIYGSGDFLNDYEGIGGYEKFRGDLVLMYLVRVRASTGELEELQLVPLKSHRLRLTYATRDDARWLHDTLNREGERFGTRLRLNHDNSLSLSF